MDGTVMRTVYSLSHEKLIWVVKKGRRGYLFLLNEIYHISYVLGPKLLFAMGCMKLGEKNCFQLPSVGEKTAN